MKVFFVFSQDRTRAVAWQQDKTTVMVRVIDQAGKTRDERAESLSLYDAMKEWGGTYSTLHIVEVEDLRSAFKYLGKSSDLAETLPKISPYDIHPEATQPA